MPASEEFAHTQQMSDFFSHDAGRTTRKVTQAPGGTSSISFGDSAAKPAPAPATPAPVVETAPEPTDTSIQQPQASTLVKMDALEEVKLKVGQDDLATFGQKFDYLTLKLDHTETPAIISHFIGSVHHHQDPKGHSRSA